MSASIEKDGNQLVIILKSGFGARDVNEFAHQQGIVLTHLETRKKSLESQFLELVKQ
jgi:ABC-2 type transport system ATP-binding protein